MVERVVDTFTMAKFSLYLAPLFHPVNAVGRMSMSVIRQLNRQAAQYAVLLHPTGCERRLTPPPQPAAAF